MCFRQAVGVGEKEERTNETTPLDVDSDEQQLTITMEINISYPHEHRQLIWTGNAAKGLKVIHRPLPSESLSGIEPVGGTEMYVTYWQTTSAFCFRMLCFGTSMPQIQGIGGLSCPHTCCNSHLTFALNLPVTNCRNQGKSKHKYAVSRKRRLESIVSICPVVSCNLTFFQ
jgi:hypothetical protein